MKNKNIAVWVVAAAVAGGGAWYFTQPGEGQTEAAAKGGPGQGGGPPTVVNVVPAKRQDVPVVLQSNGTVTPVSTVDLHPQTTSLIRKVHVKEGQFVKEGQLMFTLDDRDEQANVDKTRAQVARSRANVADLERQLKRSEDLFAQKFIARSAVDTLRSQVDAARAQLAADRAALAAENVTASYNSIRAPMSGRVGAIDVYPGSLVQVSTSLTTVTQLDPITVAFTLPESALGQLLEAQRSGAVKVEAADTSGTLSFIDNTVDPTTGTIRVKATFANRDTRLWPGQYVETRVAVQTLKDAVVVPQTAIITGTQGTFVYVAEEGKSARQQPVKRLHGFDGYAAVSGLAGGEQVITEGKQNLRPGGRIRLAGESGKGGTDSRGQATKVAAR
jgi:RND family efflux transporter MFP subunit